MLGNTRSKPVNAAWLALACRETTPFPLKSNVTCVLNGLSGSFRAACDHMVLRPGIREH